MIARVSLFCLVALPLSAQQAAPKVTIGAFIDSYYAWDTGRPVSHDRAFTTQAVRHNEFNINLAHVEATLSGERVRGRLALQAGTSAQSNYAAEPVLGVNSGADLSRHLQEAVAGVRLAPTLWIDGGIYFSHIGNESWISRDNPTYSRSFTAEYTPYYSSGVKLSWSPATTLTAQLHLINGWQNISETNDSKAIGTRIDWMVSPGATLTWASFLGNEQPVGTPARTRIFQQLMAKVRPGAGVTLWGTVDRGWQRDDGVPTTTWWSGTAIMELPLLPTLALAGRFERYVDRSGVLVAVAAPEGFDVTSGSLGFNLRLPEGVLWRSEARVFRSGGVIWPDRNGLADHAALFVTSLALTM